MTAFLKQKARETVGLEEARRAAVATAKRAQSELDAQKAHAARMAAHMAQLEDELEAKSRHVSSLEAESLAASEQYATHAERRQ